MWESFEIEVFPSGVFPIRNFEVDGKAPGDTEHAVLQRFGNL